MRSVHAVLVGALGAWLGTVVVAQQAPPTHDTASRSPSPTSPYSAIATVQDLMASMIDPASKVVFAAVTAVETSDGVKEKAPQTDEEWATIRRNALLMVESANLLLMPGRHIAPPAEARKHNEGELAPADIEVLLARNRTAWTRLATEFRRAASGALRAAEAKKADQFGAANEAIDTACENCHLRFWYPDQEQLLKNAPKAK